MLLEILAHYFAPEHYTLLISYNGSAAILIGQLLHCIHLPESNNSRVFMEA